MKPPEITINTNVFPADGKWNHHETWKAQASRVCSNTSIRQVAETTLLRYFSPAWCTGRPSTPHRGHPFEYWWSCGNGVRRILELGYSLYLLGEPEELVSDLTSDAEHARFHTRAAEAWAGVLLRSLGGQPDYIPEHIRGKKPEALVRWGSKEVALEVKSLDLSQKGKAVMLVEAHLVTGLGIGLATARFGVSNVVINVEPGLPGKRPSRKAAPDHDQETIDHLVGKLREALSASDRSRGDALLERVRDFGESLGQELREELSREGVSIGDTVTTERTIACVCKSGGTIVLDSSAFNSAVLWPQALKQIYSAADKFDAWGRPGVLVLDHPWGRWPNKLVDKLSSFVYADGGQKDWKKWFGAILLRTSALPSTHGVWVIPVPTFISKLPRELRVSQHQFIHFDVLNYAPSSRTPT